MHVTSFDRNVDNVHSNIEMRKLTNILKNPKLKPLHRYMPKVYYHDKKSGIIIMKQYEKLPYSEYAGYICNILDRLIVDTLHHYGNDVCVDNVGKYETNNCTRFVIWDLGCL